MGWAVVRAQARRIEGFLTKADPITRDMTGTARHTLRLLTLMPLGAGLRTNWNGARLELWIVA